MDFRGIVTDTTETTQELINFIKNLPISPELKQMKIEQVLMTVGQVFTVKTFEDVSYLLDSLAINSQIAVDVDNQVQRLATKIVRDSAFDLDDERLVKEFLDVLLARCEDGAFQNAHSLQKHPSLTRIIVGETCEWCKERAGTWPEPDYDLFSRHDNCDCLFIVNGYNNRNGRLNNYTKASVDSKFTDQYGNEIGWYERLRRIENGEDRNNFKLIKKEDK